jgi:ATP-dependent phosphofructokinase / diphosphate-dependent phosphofructokinase
VNQGKRIFYAHSGGVTAVINATACGVIEKARKSLGIDKVFAGQYGILGGLNEALVDTDDLSDAEVRALYHTPSSIFGTCRYKLNSQGNAESAYKRLIEVFRAHDISVFLYNGGNDSQDTAHKVWQMSERMGYPLQCLGVPKTVDNDLPHTDTCPGFGSVAKYIATSTLEASLDVAAMAKTSTKVFILETMGRHAGWIAASSALAQTRPDGPPHIILLPEVPFDAQTVLAKVKATVAKAGYCVIVASEGITDKDGQFMTQSGTTDAFGHAQLGGVAPHLAGLITEQLHFKTHWAVADYLQRSARHLAAKVDVEQAYALGEAAIDAALNGTSGVMLTIERTGQSPYTWAIGQAPLSEVANVERKMPTSFIRKDGLHVTEACLDYIRPLIMGEAYPPYQDGLPNYLDRPLVTVAKKCPEETF